MKENSQLMIEAKESLHGKWPLAIGTLVILLLISVGLSLIPFFGQIASLIMTGPLVVGASFFALIILVIQF